MSRYGSNAEIPTSTPVIITEELKAAPGTVYNCSWCGYQFRIGIRVKANRSGNILWSRCICEPCRITVFQLPTTALHKEPCLPAREETS